MKCFVVVALCLSAAVLADIDFGHYNQHQKSVEEARLKAGLYGSAYQGVGDNGLLGGHASLYAGGGSGGSAAQNSFEVVDSYGGVGVSDAANQAVLQSSASGLEAGLASQSASFGLQNAAAASQSASSQFSSSQSSNYAASSNAANALHSNVQFAQDANAGNLVSYGGLVSGADNVDTQKSYNYVHEEVRPGLSVQHLLPSAGSERYVHHEERVDSRPSQVVQYTIPGAGAEKYVHHEERVENRPAQVVQYTIPGSGAEKYVHHEERVENRPAQVVQYTIPSSGGGKFVHHEERVVQNSAPVVHYTSLPGSAGSERYIHIKKVSSSPQYIVQHPLSHSSVVESRNSFSGSSGSQLGSLLSGANLLQSNQQFGVHSGYAGSSNLHHIMSEAQRLAKQQALSSHAGVISHGASLLNAESGLGVTSGLQSGSHFASEHSSGLSSGSLLNANAALSSGSLLNSNAALSNSALFNSNAAALGLGANAGLVSSAGLSGSGAGYKSKSWQKESKWASQSAFDSDGHVNNYKELATGESEHYDINGQRSGYHAATASVDDNGKQSTYSVHS